MAERHARDLAELADLAMELARDLQACALAADDPKVKAEVASAFHRICRSARQSMALEAKLERDRLAAEREAEEHADHVRSVRLHHHRERIRIPLERLIWRETEGPEYDRLCAELEDLLDQAQLDDDFIEQEADLIIARMAAELGVELPLPPRSGEGEGGERAGADGAVTPWRSSA